MRLSIGLLFTLTLGYSLAENKTDYGAGGEVECGVPSIIDNPPTVEERIIHGIEVKAHSYPWQVALFVSEMAFCGGSLISDKVIVTAAHCLEGLFTKGNEIEVRLGAHNVLDDSEKQVRVKVTREDTVIHEEYNNVTFFIKEGAPVSFQNDIALVKLKDPVTFSENIKPICLPDSEMPEIGQDARVLGWGVDEKQKPHLQGLQKVYTKVITKDNAVSAISGLIDKATDDQFTKFKGMVLETCKKIGLEDKCRVKPDSNKEDVKKATVEAIKLVSDDEKVVTFKDGKSGGCLGDGGGGLNVEVSENKFVLAGIGSSTLLFCMMDVADPGYSTKTFHHLDWIKKNMA